MSTLRLINKNIGILGTKKPTSPCYQLHFSLSPFMFERRCLSEKVVTKEKNMNTADYMISPQYRAPRNPIVLCHGLFGFDVIGPGLIPFLQLHYWRGVDRALRQLGCKLFLTRVSPAGSIQQRALQMEFQLEKEARGLTLNFLAHSMGGLDCRYMITHLKPTTFQVLSLTTLATPHKGSPFMDWCKETIGLGFKPGIYDSVSHVRNPHFDFDFSSRPWFYPLLSRIDAPAFSNLTTQHCQHFNDFTPDQDSVYYSSYAALKPKIPKQNVLSFPQSILKKRGGTPNDGLVSLESAKWGNFLGELDCHHFELVPSKIGLTKSISDSSQDPSRFDSIGFFLSAASQLHSMGF